MYFSYVALLAFYLLAFTTALPSRFPKYKAPPVSKYKAPSGLVALAKQANWPSIRYETELFRTPKLHITHNDFNRTASGSLFFTPYGFASVTNSTLILSPNGTLIWSSSGSNFYSHLRTQAVKNELYLTFWNSSLGGPDRDNGYGSVDFLDSSYSLKYRICLAELALTTTTNAHYPCYVDFHESEVTDRGSILVTAYNVTRADVSSAGGPMGAWVLDSHFYEVDIATEKILYSWKHSNHLEEMPYHQSHYPFSVQGFQLGNAQASPWDPFHINSIQKLDDGYLISARHFWTVYKIWENGTVAWALNGDTTHTNTEQGISFSLPQNTGFHWQHHARLNNITCSPEGTTILTIFNNENSEADNGTIPSAGMTFSLDSATRKATLLQNLRDPANKIYSDAEGTHQPLSNGNSLLSYGVIPMIKEFATTTGRNSTDAGQVIYAAQFGPLTGTTSYRAFKLDGWRGMPAYPPKAVMKRFRHDVLYPNATKTAIFASWNGATEYDGWAVILKRDDGPAGIPHKPLKTAAKDGFETMISLDGVYQEQQLFVQATRNGISIRGGEAAVVFKT